MFRRDRFLQYQHGIMPSKLREPSYSYQA
jgi:hypothetical protein